MHLSLTRERIYCKNIPMETGRRFDPQEVSEAFELADYLHRSFYHPEWPDSPLTIDEVLRSNVRTGLNGLSNTERIYLSGELDDQRVYQTLTWSYRTCRFYFSTTPYMLGTIVFNTMQIMPSSGTDKLQALRQSLFMREIHAIAAARPSPHLIRFPYGENSPQ